MRYNEPAKEVRKRWGKGKTTDPHGAARDARPDKSTGRAGEAQDWDGGVPDWNEDAQDQISALLGDDADDDDDTLDLAAIRRALADKEAVSNADESTDDDDLYLVIDEILSPDTQKLQTSHDETLPSPAPADQADPVPEAGPPATSPASVMEPVFKDAVVAELLEQGAVSLPQALTAVRGQTENPDTALWRLLADLPEVNRARIFEQAANLLGFETLAIDDKIAPDFIQAVVELLPEQAREHLVAYNLLPLKLKMDPEARQQRLLLVTHDPSHPQLQALLDSFGMPVDLCYASEDDVAQSLEQMQALQEGANAADQAAVIDVDLTASEDAAAPTEPEPAAKPEDEPTPAETITITEDFDFLEVQWEPFAGNGPDAETSAPAAQDQPGEAETLELDWKPLAEWTEAPSDEAAAAEPDLDPDDVADQPAPLSAETASSLDSDAFEFTLDELNRLGQTDVPPTEEIALDDTIARELLDTFESGESVNGDTPNNGAASFDGVSLDLPDHTLIPDVADWTQHDQPESLPDEDPDPQAEEIPEPKAAPDPRIPAEPVSPPEPQAETTPEPEETLAVGDEEVEELLGIDLNKIKAKDRVVAMLLRKGIVGAREIKRAQTKQQEEQLKEPLWRVMTLLDGVKRTAIFAEAAGVYAFKTAEMGEGKPDPEFARSVMETFEEGLRDSLLQLRVVPLEVDLDQQTGAIKVVFITHDPARPEVHRMMQKLRLERFELRYAAENVVTALILEAFPRKNEFLERLDEHDALDMGISYEEKNDLIDEDMLEAEINRSKLINLFEATLVEAVRQDASDVHIWPNARKQVEIHFRIDGRLRRWHVEDKVHPEAFIAVVKDNSMNVDRFERDAAQDGFIQRWIDEALIRFRVSILPIANAAQEVRSESIVIRVLDDRKVVKDLSKLGLNELALERFRKAISQPHGMVILTGPTGSGKTTTLYASIHEVINPEVNVLTVEDPVEYILPGVRQIKLNNKLGLDGALRSILRHDPDVVMVGEMRDKPTAELAIKLANTGHLTFSTLHTNDAASAVTRLYKMGIEPFLIAYAINLVVAQRLIRRLCPTCKKVDQDPDHVLMRKLGFSKEEIASTEVYTQGHDENCPTCKGVGFKGRRAVSEAMYFSREIRHLIADSEGMLDEGTIKDMAVGQGMMTLSDSARHVVMEGDSSILEMMRVVSTED